MKNLHAIGFVLICIGCKSTWSNPTIERYENGSPVVLSVAINDTATIVEMEKHIGYGFNFNDATILVTDEMISVPLIQKDDLPNYNDVRNDSIMRFKLMFNAIHKDVKRIDIIEGAGERDFRIWGIRPKGKQLVEHVYNPSVSDFNEEDIPFMKKILNKYLGKIIVIQVVDDIDLPESVTSLRHTIHAQKQFANDIRISFVAFSRPSNQDDAEAEKGIYIDGKAIFVENISLEEYNHLVSIVRPYLSKDKTICLDQALRIITPGLIFNSVKLLDEQFKKLSSKE